MKEARAHGSAVQQGGLAACAHEKQPQLQDGQLGGSSAEDAARADKRQGPPSSAAGAPRSLPETNDAGGRADAGANAAHVVLEGEER